MQSTASRTRPRPAPAAAPPRALPGWVLPLGAAWLAFWPALGGEVLGWDDATYLADSAIQGTTCFWERLTSIFSSFYFSNYNPFHRAGNWLQVSLFGRDARVMHGASLLGHAVNSTLVFVCLRRLRLRREVALLASLLFAVHPSRVEVAAWISAQKDIGSVLFSLLAVCVYAPVLTGSAPRARLRLLGVAALFLAGLLFKSQVVVLPALLLVLDAAWGRPLGRALVEKLPLFVLSAAFSALTVRAAPPTAPVGGEWTSHVATVLQAPWHYLHHVLWPFGYSARHWVPRASLGDAPVLPGAAGLLALVAGLGFVLRRIERRWAWLGVAWPLVCMLPVSNIVPLPIVVAERYLYLALLGPFVVVAEALARWRRTVPVPGANRGLPARAVVAGLVLVVLGLSSMSRAAAFRDTRTLWRTSLAAEPGNPVVRLYLARDLIDSGDVKQAREALALLDELRQPGMAEFQALHVETARAHRLLGNGAEADAALDAAVELAAEGRLRFETAMAQARRLSGRGDDDAAHRVLERVPALPDHRERRRLALHARICLEHGDDEGYLRWNRRQIELQPFSLVLWNNREHVARRVGHDHEARRCAERFAELAGEANVASSR